MILEEENFYKALFNGLDQQKYTIDNNLHKLVGVDLEEYGDLTKKQIKDTYFSVNPDLNEVFSPEMDDLSRLHFLITTRKVTTILEFGLGKSTIIFNDALLKNKKENEEFVCKNLRRTNPFECHIVDNYKKWIDEVRLKNDLSSVMYNHSELVMGTFNDRVCTYYSSLPNICPDFIYLDGPDQFSPIGNIKGVTTNHPDRLPMSADILAIEHFLLPGTLIVTDGRTANARFLKSNLQRDWLYFHNIDGDQHYFELCEPPLGIYNKRQIDFCLGESFYNRLIS